MMNRLNNFSPVYYITLEDSVERQKKIETQYEFTLPLFVEDVTVNSTFYPLFLDQPTKKGQIESSNFVYNWWKENGHKVNVNELMTFKEARYWDN